MQHVYRLRGADGRIRADIDARLELMAQEHYKCFLSLSIAQGGLDDDAHPERTFSSLQNAGNRAQQVIRLFNDIRAACLPADRDPLDPARFAALTNLLDSRCRMLLDHSPALLTSLGYRQLLPPQVGAANVVMQRIVLSSNVQLG